MARSVAVLLAAVFAGVLAVALGGCASSDPPPRSPFGDDGATPAVTQGTPRPLPTFPAPTVEVTPPGGGTPSPADGAERERVTAEAISRLAEWTGIPETEIQPGSVEAVEWPSACLGVDAPGIACADVITPGYRITLGIQGEPQYVHASREHRYAWAPAFDAERVIESVDLAASTVTFEPLTGSDEMGREHRVAPGSQLDIPLRDLQPGQRVHVATTYEVPSLGATFVVWLVPLE